LISAPSRIWEPSGVSGTDAFAFWSPVCLEGAVGIGKSAPRGALGLVRETEDAGASFTVDATAGGAMPGWDSTGVPCGLASVANETAVPSTVGGGVMPAAGRALVSETADATGFLLGERARAWVGDGRVASSKKRPLRSV
jgi:hypothetical protein